MNQLTELQDLPPLSSSKDREHETYSEDAVKEAIIRGKGTKTIAAKHDVSQSFVIKCRKELRNEGRI